jgi:hypothetical protein
MRDEMQIIVYSNFGTYVVPDSVRDKIRGKLRLSGDADRRFRAAKAINRYHRMVQSALKRRWLDA